MTVLTSFTAQTSGADAMDTLNKMLADLKALQPGSLMASVVPKLAGAYAAGRGIATIIGDSTSAPWGSGSGGPNGTQNGSMATGPAAALRARLNAAGIVATDGCVVFGNRITLTDQTEDLTTAGLAYANPFTTTSGNAGDGFTYGPSNKTGLTFRDLTPWGTFAFYDGSKGASLQWTPGITYDRVEWWMGNTSNGCTIEVSAGGTVIDKLSETSTPYNLTKRSVTAPFGSGELKFREAAADGTTDQGAVGAARVWNSTLPHQVQVETLGNPGWKTSDWATTGHKYSPLTAISTLGSHLYIINLGLNDHAASRTAAAFKADLKTIAQACLSAGGDVLLAIPTYSTISGYQLDQTYIDAITQAASELALPAPINLQLIGTLPADNNDGVHLKKTGYTKVGQAYGGVLLGQ